MIVKAREEISEDALGSYIISMTHTGVHVLEVMFLAWQAGVITRDEENNWIIGV